MSHTIRPPETLPQVFARIVRDSNQPGVNVPVTALQLAGAAVVSGFRHPDHPTHSNRTIRCLADDIEACWPAVGGDPRKAGAAVAALGWALPRNWRANRTNTPAADRNVGASAQHRRDIAAERIKDGCAHGHGPDKWQSRPGGHSYCQTCRAEMRARTRKAAAEYMETIAATHTSRATN